MRPIEEQTILVTGSTDGLGRRVAEELAKRGARVIVHGRNPDKVQRTQHELDAAKGLTADLSDLNQVRRLAEDTDRLDTLVNNAGVIVPERTETADGHELTFAVNYLSQFLLTKLLLPKLREPARIVNVSSIGQAPLDFDDLDYARGYQPYDAYARSKLAQVLFTNELAQHLGGRDVTVNALHPATLMDTNMVRGALGRPRSSVDEGAQATLRLITDPELDATTGAFFDGTREASAHPQAYDPSARKRLWDESERLTAR